MIAAGALPNGPHATLVLRAAADAQVARTTASATSPRDHMAATRETRVAEHERGVADNGRRWSSRSISTASAH